MMTLTATQQEMFAQADDFHIAPYRADGKTPGTLTWIWSVVVDGELYVRAWNGQRSRWYNAAKDQGAGKIMIAGDEYTVAFDLCQSLIMKHCKIKLMTPTGRNTRVANTCHR